MRGGRGLRRVVATAVGLTLLALAPTIWTRAVTMPRSHSVADAPAMPVALVLGASVQANGVPSPFLADRLQLALELYGGGKVRAVLVSGDHGSKGYDEPTAMRDWLVQRGVPAGKVVADFAGFDTYDSCYRAGAVFGADRIIVVTQTYHLQRAVATCRAVGLDAVGVGDSSRAGGSEAWRRGVIREVGATWKMVWDLATRRKPTLGPRETSLDDALR